MAVPTTQLHLPDFLCVGAQKAGTTTLHTLLKLHPEIFLPEQKELQYFTLHFSEGLEWYSGYFDTTKKNQCIGEITPYYLFHPFVAKRASNVLGRIKIIILLRDPIARTISHYGHARRLGFEDLPLKEALAAENSRLEGSERALRSVDGVHKQHQECSYLNRSLYRLQVQRYWEYFGKQNVYIQPSESLFSDPWESLKKIHEFLGLKEQRKPDRSALSSWRNKGERAFKQKNKLETIKTLRYMLNESYVFVRQELGWDSSLPWEWAE